RHSIAIIVAMMIAASSFILASMYTQYKLNDIESKAVRLKEITTPSLEYLAKTKERLDELSSLLEPPQIPDQSGSIDESVLSDIQKSGDTYLNLEVLPGEHSLWANLKSQLAEVRGATQRLIELQNPMRDPQKTRQHIHLCQ